MVVADDQVAVRDVHALLTHCGTDQQLDLTCPELLNHTFLFALGHPCELIDGQHSTSVLTITLRILTANFRVLITNDKMIALSFELLLLNTLISFSIPFET